MNPRADTEINWIVNQQPDFMSIDLLQKNPDLPLLFPSLIFRLVGMPCSPHHLSVVEYKGEQKKTSVAVVVEPEFNNWIEDNQHFH